MRTDVICPSSSSALHRDEDMQSLASLMSMKQSDIGNMEDFNDSDEDVGEDRRVGGVRTGQATAVTGKSERLNLTSLTNPVSPK